MNRFAWIWLLAPVLALVACASGTVQQTRYQLSQTRPGDVINPQAKDAPNVPNGPFAHWAAVIVAGDDISSSGEPTQTFDNARKDLATAFVRAGFARDHVFQFSSAPKSSDPTNPRLANVDAVKGGLHHLLGVAGQGCLIYVTSHGNTQGIKFGERLASPTDIAALADRTCGERPTVMILSACHSGVFVHPLEADNRLVMSAARSDRSSFGCGTNDKYPYFDQCMIDSLPSAHNFIVLADEVKSCVSRMEKAEHFVPSEPQLAVGQSIKPLLASSTFVPNASFNVATCADQSETAPCPAKSAPPASSAAAGAH